MAVLAQLVGARGFSVRAKVLTRWAGALLAIVMLDKSADPRQKVLMLKKYASREPHLYLVARQRERLKTTASAIGHFGRGVDVACEAEPRAARTGQEASSTESTADLDTRRSRLIIVSLGRMVEMRRLGESVFGPC